MDVAQAGGNTLKAANPLVDSPLASEARAVRLKAECHESRSWQSLILLGSGFSIFGGLLIVFA